MVKLNWALCSFLFHLAVTAQFLDALPEMLHGALNKWGQFSHLGAIGRVELFQSELIETALSLWGSSGPA